VRESTLQAKICAALTKLGFYAVQIRAEARDLHTRAPGAPSGWPDIRVEPYGWIEAGSEKRKKRDQQHQLKVHRRIRAAGGRVVILPAEMESVAAAVRIVMEWRKDRERMLSAISRELEWDEEDDDG
jgi:hypothetical protein